MELVDLKDGNLGELIENNQKVIIQFGASWCGNCRITKPKFKTLATQYEDVLFVLVDAEKNPQAREYGDVSNLPTFTTYKNGVLVDNLVNGKATQIESLVKNIL